MEPNDEAPEDTVSLDDATVVDELIALERSDDPAERTRAAEFYAAERAKLHKTMTRLDRGIMREMRLATPAIDRLRKAMETPAFAAAQKAMASPALDAARKAAESPGLMSGFAAVAVKMAASQEASGLSAALDKVAAQMPQRMAFLDVGESSTFAKLASQLDVGRASTFAKLAADLDVSPWTKALGEIDVAPLTARLAQIDAGPSLVELARDLDADIPKAEFSAVVARDQANVSDALSKLERARREREDHQFEAEQASIRTSELLDALVGVAHAQQQQLVHQAELLEAAVASIGTLARQQDAAAALEDERWEKTWRVQRASLVGTIAGAMFALLAVWAAFAAAKPPVERVLAPPATAEAPTTIPAPAPTAPAPPVPGQPTPN